MVAEILWTKEECKAENLAGEKCKIIIDNDEQHLSVSFDGKTHGLIFANLAIGAKKAHVLFAKVKAATMSGSGMKNPRKK